MNSSLYPLLDDRIVIAPYVWKPYQSETMTGVEATMPGAYLRFAFVGSSRCCIRIDTTANENCPAESMPVVEYSIDGGAFRSIQLDPAGKVYDLPLSGTLELQQVHRIEFFFRAADLCRERWFSPLAHLRLIGIVLDEGGKLCAQAGRSHRAIGFGDSITEGVGIDGYFTSWQQLSVNHARASWLPLVCTALDCEYGQLGSGGQGMVNTSMPVPPLPQTWHRYDASASRLTDERLLPEPDYIFCAMGTNDFKNQDYKQPEDITDVYTEWLNAVRQACPTARIFCVVPPFGWHREEIRTAVATRRLAGDNRVDWIDTRPLRDGFIPGYIPSQLAYDGVHPSMYGSALLAAVITAAVRTITDGVASISFKNIIEDIETNVNNFEKKGENNPVENTIMYGNRTDNATVRRN